MLRLVGLEIMVIFFFSVFTKEKEISKTTWLLIKCVVVVKKSNVAESNELKKILLNMDVSLNVSKHVFLFVK